MGAEAVRTSGRSADGRRPQSSFQDGSAVDGRGPVCSLTTLAPTSCRGFAAISTGPEQARAGIQKLADGVWKTLKDGYDPGIGDVEHSSEPSADTAPAMLLLCYGDPLYVERNMLSCRTIKERFMGIDANGYPRFISSEFGAGGVNRQPQAGGDTGYHARAMKHLLWQAWWGDPVAHDWFARWADGWRAKTAARIAAASPAATRTESMPPKPPCIWRAAMAWPAWLSRPG